MSPCGAVKILAITTPGIPAAKIVTAGRILHTGGLPVSEMDYEATSLAVCANALVCYS